MSFRRSLRLALCVCLLAGLWLTCTRWIAARTVTTDDVMRAWMARFDRDHDGRISRDEWLYYGGRPETFEGFDFNGDGYLDAHEFETFFLNAGQKRVGQ